VAISLGAMSLGDDDALETARLFVDAVDRAGVRAIIQGWDVGMRQLDLPPEVYAAGPLPHDWLLPRCVTVVHHGGFGTTSAGLRAGIPVLIIPHVVDQFYWGQRVQELGVGLPPIRRTRLDATRLAAALEELVHDTALRDAASVLGEQIRAENGIQNAVCLIEETYG
jgi:UDP:flavonoid glycosyltransferase YjiC (YdhE family)